LKRTGHGAPISALTRVLRCAMDAREHAGIPAVTFRRCSRVSFEWDGRDKPAVTIEKSRKGSNTPEQSSID
jgi:hypothetical protein